MNGTTAQMASTLVFVLRQYYELTDLPDTADDEAVYEWIKGRLSEVDRLRQQHQGQAEHITVLGTAVDRLTAALIERDTEVTRLRAERFDAQSRLAWLFNDRAQDGTLSHALLITEAEVTRLRAAEQRTRELCETPHVYVVSTDDVLDILDGKKRDLSGLADLGYDAALDGGRP